MYELTEADKQDIQNYLKNHGKGFKSRQKDTEALEKCLKVFLETFPNKLAEYKERMDVLPAHEKRLFQDYLKQVKYEVWSELATNN